MTKPKTERYEIDGVVVELVKMTPDTTRAYHGGPEPVVRSQWKIKVDGVLRGYAVYPKGVGKPWQAYSLLPGAVKPYGFEFNSERRIIRVWKDEPTGDDGMWDHYNGRFGYLTPVYRDGTNNHSYLQVFTSREQIARAWPQVVAAGFAPVVEEVEQRIVLCREIAAERKRQDAENSARIDRENAERRAREEQARVEAEERRVETLTGLESIRDRFSGQLTNLEAAALATAIERYEP